MKAFIFIWNDGKTEIGEGENVANAFGRLGYSAGALQALDYFQELPESNFAREFVFVIQANNDSNQWSDTKYGSNDFREAQKIQISLLEDDDRWLAGERGARIAINKKAI